MSAAKVLAGERNASAIFVIEHMLPLYYLLCHAMELSLKAYLSAKGYDDDALKNVGHSLKRCAKKAASEGLTLSPEFEQMVDWLDYYHYDNAFRYHRERRLNLPLPHELIDRIEPQISDTFKNREPNGSDLLEVEKTP